MLHKVLIKSILTVVPISFIFSSLMFIRSLEDFLWVALLHICLIGSAIFGIWFKNKINDVTNDNSAG